jgi:hypothetical protein
LGLEKEDHEMSGFSLKSFKGSLVNAKSTPKSTFIRHVVIGNDLAALLQFHELVSLWGLDHVIMVSSQTLSWEDFYNRYACSVNLIQSEEEVIRFKQKYIHSTFDYFNEEINFFKDNKIYSFHSKIKHQPFLVGEEVMKSNYARLKFSSLFNSENHKEEVQNLVDKIQIKLITEIEKMSPDDLEKRVEFKLKTGENEILECEFLYWHQSPKLFFNLLSNSDSLAPDHLQYLARSEDQAGLVVSFTLAKEILRGPMTLFIPRSASQEQGHFVAEIDPFLSESQVQSWRVLMFLNEEEQSSEDIAKEVKLMKRVISRIYPEFQKFLKSESLRLDPRMFNNSLNQNFQSISYHPRFT